MFKNLLLQENDFLVNNIQKSAMKAIFREREREGGGGGGGRATKRDRERERV